jgi:hypothetical protein
MTDRRTGILFLGFVATVAVLLLLTFMVAIAGGFGLFEVIWRLLTGSISFLRDNLPRISADAGTWGPGLAAFGLALVMGHYFLRGWAKKRNRRWSAGSTLCAGMVLPLLFAISFLVPGVLLQFELLGEMKWFERRRDPEALLKQQLRSLGMVLFAYDEVHARLPDSLDELAELEFFSSPSVLLASGEGGSPPEPPIYLGRWLTMESDGSLPLLISPSYTKDSVKIRQVLTMSSEFVEIRDEEVDEWIDKAMAAGTR